MVLTARIRLLCASLWLCACVPTQRPPDGPPVPDAGCAAACETLRRLPCPAGQPTEDGEPCEAVCEGVERFLPGGWQTECVAGSTSCEQADECGEDISEPGDGLSGTVRPGQMSSASIVSPDACAPRCVTSGWIDGIGPVEYTIYCLPTRADGTPCEPGGDP